MAVYAFNARYRIFTVTNVYTPSEGTWREVTETWSDIGTCYFDSGAGELYGSYLFEPAEFYDVQLLEGATVLPAVSIAPKSTSDPNYRLDSSSPVGVVAPSDTGGLFGYMNWRAKGVEQDYDAYAHEESSPNWPSASQDAFQLLYCFGSIDLAAGHSLPDNRLNITYEQFQTYQLGDSASVPRGIRVEFRLDRTSAIGLHMLDTTDKPEKDNPVIADTVNKLYIRDGNNAIVYYIHRGRDYTQALRKGLGNLWHGLGDGYVTKALIMEHYAWVFIGSDKYVIKSQGMGLNTYG